MRAHIPSAPQQGRPPTQLGREGETGSNQSPDQSPLQLPPQNLQIWGLRCPQILHTTSFKARYYNYHPYVSRLRPDATARTDADLSLGFGFGRHYCLGAHLAKLEIKAFFRALLPRLDAIELAGEPSHMHSVLVSGPKHLPIRYRMR